jgi:hypothetical protein
MIGRRRWKAVEIAQVVERYPEEGPLMLAVDLHRSIDSIMTMAARFGLLSKSRRTRQSATQRLRRLLHLGFSHVPGLS